MKAVKIACRCLAMAALGLGLWSEPAPLEAFSSCLDWLKDYAAPPIYMRLGAGGGLIEVAGRSNPVLATFDPNGGLLGTVALNPAVPSPNAALVEANGEVIVTGGSAFPVSVLTTVYDAAGDSLVSVSGDTGQSGLMVAADAAGNFLVLNQYSVGGAFVRATKYDPLGNVLWVRTYPGTSPAGLFPTSAAFDASGNELIAGNGSDPAAGNSQGVFVIKVDSSGTTLWQKFDHQGIGTNAEAVADPAGNVLVSSWGGYSNGSPGDFHLDKYDPNGNLLWSRTDVGTPLQNATPSIACDAAGDVVLSGSRGSDLVRTLVYDGSGDTLMAYNDNRLNPIAALQFPVAVDPSGDIFLAMENSDGVAEAAKYDHAGCGGKSGLAANGTYVFPEPARGDTANFGFNLPGPATVKIVVSNAAADPVARIQQHMDAGRQALPFHIGRYAPGVYFFRAAVSYDNGDPGWDSNGKFRVLP